MTFAAQKKFEDTEGRRPRSHERNIKTEIKFLGQNNELRTVLLEACDREFVASFEFYEKVLRDELSEDEFVSAIPADYTK